MTALDVSGILRAPVVPSSTGRAAWTNVDDSATEVKHYAIPSFHPQAPYIQRAVNNGIYHSNSAHAYRQAHHRGRFAAYRKGWSLKHKRHLPIAEIERLATQLYQDFMKIPQYRNYRSRHPKKNENKWPDHAEWAFWKAIIMNPPCGREQEQLHQGGKKMGRNEIIADYISLEIGEPRARKQVSSHIQVLKDYVGPNKELLSFLLTPSGMGKHNAQKLAHQAQQRLGPSAPIHRPTEEAAEAILQKAILQSTQQGKKKDKDSSVEMQRFALYVHSVTSQGQDTGHPPTHLYTDSDSDSHLPDTKFETWNDCFQRYPNMENSSINLLGVKGFLSANASLSFPQGLSTAQQNLSVSMMLTGFFDKKKPLVQSKTTFFDNGKQEDAIYQKGDVQRRDGDKDGSPCVYHIPFCTREWVQYLTKLGGVLSKAGPALVPGETAADCMQRQQNRQLIRSGVSTTLRNFTAIQEIFICSEKSYKEAEILLVVHWSFDLAQEGHPGKTTWSKLVLPKLDDILDRGEMLEEDLDFTKLEDGGSLQLDIDPHLQSPIEFIEEAQSQSQSQLSDSWCTSANPSQVFKLEDETLHTIIPSGNQIIYDDHNSLGNNLSQIDVGYGTTTPMDDFDFSQVDFDAAQSQACFSQDVYQNSWDHFEDVFDPSLVLPAADSVYPTPPTAPELERFPAFGLECPPQAEAGAAFEIKEERESQ